MGFRLNLTCSYQVVDRGHHVDGAPLWTKIPPFLVAPLAQVNTWMTTNTNIGHFLGNIRGGDTRLRRRRGENFAPEEVLQEVILARAEGAKKILPLR